MFLVIFSSLDGISKRKNRTAAAPAEVATTLIAYCVSANKFVREDVAVPNAAQICLRHRRYLRHKPR